MSDTEIGCYEAELLPARTVMSMRTSGIQGILGTHHSGPSGPSGNQGGTSHPHNVNPLWWLNQLGTTNSGANHIAGSEVGSAGADANG